MVALMTALQTVAVATTLLLTLTQPASALMASGLSGGQGTLDATSKPPTVPPPAPESVPRPPILSARWKTQSEVMLDYIDKSLVETGFHLEQRRAGGLWQVIDTLDPLSGMWAPRNYRVSGLEPRTDYCFRLVAFNALGNSPPSEVCVRTTYAGACDETTLEAVLAPAAAPGDAVEIRCDLYLEPQNFVFKRLLFIGSHANGWLSISCRLNAALSTPSSTSLAARRNARGLAHRNDPVSVVSPAYRQYATSRSIGLPHASRISATSIVVESAVASTKFALPNRRWDLW